MSCRILRITAPLLVASLSLVAGCATSPLSGALGTPSQGSGSDYEVQKAFVLPHVLEKTGWLSSAGATMDAAVAGTVKTTREAGSGMATGKRQYAPRDAATGQASGKRQHSPRDVATGQSSGKR